MTAKVALVLAVLALLGLVLHVLVPTPPAHTFDPLGLRGS